METYKQKKLKQKQQQEKNRFQKIRLFLLIVALVCSLSILIIKTFAPSILYGLGQNAYKHQKYEEAANFFKTSYLLNPQDNLTAYYWASSISKLQLIYPYQKDLYKISQLDNDSAADMLATTILQSFKVNLMMKVGSNYIESALFNDEVLHWNISSMPLKYYIDTTTSTPKYFIDTVNESFNSWENKSNRLVRFQQVQDPNEANIILAFKNIDNSLMAKGDKSEYNVGEANPTIKDDRLEQMNIQIVTQNNLKQYFTKNEVATVVKHEIGHALGLWGHSKNINDIMYYSASDDFGFLGTSAKDISPDDVNTLRLLYFLAPDITNQSISQEEKKYYLFAPVVTNKFEDNNNFYIQKSIANTIKTPDDVSVWIELASAYSDNKNYDKSIETLNKAAEMTQDPENLAIIYYNMANDSVNNKQIEEAMNYANKAKLYKNDYETKSLVAYIKYKQENYDEARADLESLMEERPDDIDNALTLTDIYIKQRKYWSARSTIKKLIKNNPEARDDERLSYYKIYVLF